MTDNVYNKVYLDSLGKVLESILKDLQSEEFNWERFLKSMIEEDSPLEEVFSTKTLQLADLHLLALQLKEASSTLEEVSVIKEEESA